MNDIKKQNGALCGSVHSFETLGALDGPGMRTVVFLSGCPMRCRYCHNPDTWEKNEKEVMTASEVFQKIKRMKPYFGKSGGITLSGGEPLLQTEFATEVFRLCKEDRIHTALDTSGAIVTEQTESLLKLTDLVICDIKHTDQDAFLDLTSYPMDSLLSFLELCKRLNKRLWIRQVIVPGITDNQENILKLKDMAKKYDAEKIELLPYHSHGVYKWESLGIPYTLYGTKSPTEEEMKQLNELLK
ncbi:MAG: pyruvate formate lyase-activating protein [Clostridia bacterium]|nr:pyruvate formate lyase-activating protein [Clostridia bacterium]